MFGYTGEIKFFGGFFAPENWMICDGRPLNINNYNDLFSILSNRFGGDGIKTFKLPDLRGRVPVGAQNSPPDLGRLIGYDSIEIPISAFMPHSHTPQFNDPEITVTAAPGCFNGEGKAYSDPENRFYGPSPSTKPLYHDSSTSEMGETYFPIKKSGPYKVEVETVGGTEMISVVQPSLCLICIICVNGVFPRRS